MRLANWHSFLLVLAAAIGSWPAESHALNRCVDQAGKVTYSDRLCAKGDTQTRTAITPTRIHDTTPSNAASSPPRAASQATATPPAPLLAGSLGPSADRVACERALWEYERLPSRVPPRTTPWEMERKRLRAQDICQRPIEVSDGEKKLRLERLTSRDYEAAAQAERDWEREHDAQCSEILRSQRCTGTDCRDREGYRCESLGR